ncbi:MAG: hypothetical protein ACRCXZ_05680 [Patescibacteria group bacterium]
MNLTIHNHCATVIGGCNLTISENVKVVSRSNGVGDKIGSACCFNVISGAVSITQHDNGLIEVDAISADEFAEGEIELTPEYRRVGGGMFRSHRQEFIEPTFKKFAIHSPNTAGKAEIIIV